MRYPRAFYKSSGVFREHSTVCNKAYELLRSATTSNSKPYSSLEDIFYGAFKIGAVHSPNEATLDTDFAMLTSRYLVIIEPNNF